jgi:hypothetical protein
MKMRRHTQIPGTMLAVMLTLLVVQGLGFGPEAQAEGSRGLEGTWLHAVTIVTCPSAPHAVIATFQSMTTYPTASWLCVLPCRSSSVKANGRASPSRQHTDGAASGSPQRRLAWATAGARASGRVCPCPVVKPPCQVLSYSANTTNKTHAGVV